MKALISREPGGPQTLALADLPDPVPGAGQVRVAVRACGVNYPDLLIIQDLYQIKPPRPFAPGSEVAGIVDAVGDGVTNVAVGDRVLLAPVRGGMAELAVGDARNCWKIPQSMPFDEAACLVMTYGTSYHALKDRAALKAGETLLVLGAAGGVGMAAVELGKSMGARVIAAASSQEKVALAQEVGAEAGVVYPLGPLDKADAKALTERFKAACGADGANVIYDAIGGDYAEAALRSIAWNGRFLVVGFPAGIPKIPLNLPLLKNCQIVGVFWGDSVARRPQQHAQNMSELLALYGEGRIRPMVTERFPLARGGDAIARLGARATRGKLAVVMG
jgi:NADPH2:quinone reductase